MKITTICTLVIVVSIHLLQISQMDLKNAFLNDDLQGKSLHDTLPSVSYNLGEVCKLKKALYGLKQTPCA